MKWNSLLSHILTAIITSVVVFAIAYFFIYAPSDIAVLKSEIKYVKESQLSLKNELSTLDQRLHELLIALASKNGINPKGLVRKTTLQGVTLKEKNKLIIDLLLLDNTKERKKYLAKKGFSKSQISKIIIKNKFD